MNAILVMAALTTAVLARPEPPVHSSYLPPSIGTSTTTFAEENYPLPSPKYGPPTTKYGPPTTKFVPSIKTVTKADVEDYDSEPPSYNFKYKVQDEEAALDFGHQEEREGQETKGEYSVLLPDGKILRVKYTANESGYNPELSYEESRGTFTTAVARKKVTGPY